MRAIARTRRGSNNSLMSLDHFFARSKRTMETTPTKNEECDMNADTPQSRTQNTPDSAVLDADMDRDEPDDNEEVIITVGERLVVSASKKKRSRLGLGS